MRILSVTGGENESDLPDEVAERERLPQVCRRPGTKSEGNRGRMRMRMRVRMRAGMRMGALKRTRPPHALLPPTEFFFPKKSSFERFTYLVVPKKMTDEDS